MADPNGTQWLRADVGCKTDEVFIAVVAGRLGWSQSQIETDIYNQLVKRGCNARLARDLQQRLLARLNSKFKLSKLVKDAKDTWDSIKGFALTPLSIAKIAYGSLGALATMAFTENDLGMDVNKNTFLSDEYFDFLIYSYLTRGKMQPRYRVF